MIRADLACEKLARENSPNELKLGYYFDLIVTILTLLSVFFDTPWFPSFRPFPVLELYLVRDRELGEINFLKRLLEKSFNAI